MNSHYHLWSCWILFSFPDNLYNKLNCVTSEISTLLQRILYLTVNTKTKLGIMSVTDIKSRGQLACQEEQKTCKEESMNVMHKCDVYKCVLCTVYYIVMFACTSARSLPESKRRWVKLELLSLTAINSILWTSVATRRCSPEWGQGRVQYTRRRGSWRTYLWGASRRLMFKYVH